MRESEIGELLGVIEKMDLETLRQFWGERYGVPPPLRSVQIIQMMLAWRIQAEAYGGLDADTLNALGRRGSVEPEGRHLGIGARLSRNWKGRKVEVIVEERGFRWEGKLYRSLSAVATAIAGSKWNGPKFFGLRDAA